MNNNLSIPGCNKEKRQEFERLMVELGIEGREESAPYILDDILFGMAQRIIELERQIAANEKRTDKIWNKLMRWPYPWTKGAKNL